MQEGLLLEGAFEGEFAGGFVVEPEGFDTLIPTLDGSRESLDGFEQILDVRLRDREDALLALRESLNLGLPYRCAEGPFSRLTLLPVLKPASESALHCPSNGPDNGTARQRVDPIRKHR